MRLKISKIIALVGGKVFAGGKWETICFPFSWHMMDNIGLEDLENYAEFTIPLTIETIDSQTPIQFASEIQNILFDW